MSDLQRVTVLAGGVGGARFIRGLLAHLNDAYPGPEGSSRVETTVVVNTGDDLTLDGLRVCPDLDTVMYTLGGGISEEQGWGRADESRRVSAEIAAYGRGWDWFTLGDLDLGTHIVRTELLRGGATLSEATEYLCRRWRPGARLLPMSDQPVETHVRLGEARDEHPAGSLIHFEEWWVRYRAHVAATEFVQIGLEGASAAPGVIEAIQEADVVIFPPSNPVVSVGTILNVPKIRQAVHETSARVVGVSPIIGGAAVRGMADACLTAIGVETSAAAVGLHYGSRASDGTGSDGLLDGWLVDESDAHDVPRLAAAGLSARAVPLWMRDVPATARMASAALDLAFA